MTQAELWQLQLMAVANSTEAFEGVLTIVFAYLATTYFVGRRLTRAQVVLVSVFFLVGATLSAFMAFVEFRRAAMFMAQLTAEFGVESISPNAVTIPLFALVFLLLIAASVVFMFQVRRRATGRPPGESQ